MLQALKVTKWWGNLHLSKNRLHGGMVSLAPRNCAAFRGAKGDTDCDPFHHCSILVFGQTPQPTVESASPWRTVVKPRHFAFPRDHAAHEDYRIEWWYYTGNLQAEDGRRFGYQLTFFARAWTTAPRILRAGRCATCTWRILPFPTFPRKNSPSTSGLPAAGLVGPAPQATSIASGMATGAQD